MRTPWPIEINPYLFDHRMEGRCLFPAVEALITLAAAVNRNFPQADMRCLTMARFSRFLVIPPETRRVTALVDFEQDQADRVSAKLLTQVRSKSGGIGRHLEHARVEFLLTGSCKGVSPQWESPENPDMAIPVESIYSELIPFGPAYQNIIGPASVSRSGAWALLSGGDHQSDESLLGSPFPLDAAFHLACVWGQRFNGIVPFPTGFEKRTIHQKTKNGGSYMGRIIPVTIDEMPLIFDALIFDLKNTLCEEIRGIQMQDVSQGRLRPPLWIKAW
ncbi:MAG: hypothetical protein WA974_11705 [Thermodesulfobacteriota bacterium]